MDSHDVMRALAEHAKTLGWEIPEWDWKDDIDGDSEYQVWLRPAALACGEVGTGWPGGLAGGPVDTEPCALPADHYEDHDWAQREPAEVAEKSQPPSARWWTHGDSCGPARGDAGGPTGRACVGCGRPASELTWEVQP